MPQLAKGGVGGAGLAGSNHVNADITPTGLPSRGAIGEMTLSNTFADQLRKSHLKSAEVEKMCTFTHVCMYIITIVRTTDPSGCARKGQGENLARKCFAGMEWLCSSFSNLRRDWSGTTLIFKIPMFYTSCH